ncbi:RluA family pseudouridine synthase [bacterium]|nr:RluA family pseudouridine synthase [bacterium]
MTKKYVFSVQSLSQPLRLDAFLSQQREFSSRSQVQNLIKKHQVIVNGQCAKASLLVKNDDEISVDLSEEFSVIIKPEDIPLDIVWEDDDILIVNKPKNMITHPTIKETTGTLVNALLNKYGYDGLSNINGVMRPGIVHRLDRNTSGILMIAKNNHSHEFLSEQIKTKSAIRKYLAVVQGNFDSEFGTIDAPILRHPSKPEKMAVVEGGKPSVTHYKVLEQFKGYSFLELQLETGRTHQIRVHMNYIAHPIVNDSLYCKSQFKVKTIEQVLQSYSLKFATLKSGDIIELEIPQDDDIQRVLKYLRSNLK